MIYKIPADYDRNAGLAKALLSNEKVCYECRYASLHHNGFSLVGGCLCSNTIYEFPKEFICDYFLPKDNKYSNRSILDRTL